MQRIGPARRAKHEGEPGRQKRQPFRARRPADDRPGQRLAGAEQGARDESLADIGAPDLLAQRVLHAHGDRYRQQGGKAGPQRRQRDGGANQREFRRQHERQAKPPRRIGEQRPGEGSEEKRADDAARAQDLEISASRDGEAKLGRVAAHERQIELANLKEADCVDPARDQGEYEADRELPRFAGAGGTGAGRAGLRRHQR